MTTMKIFIIDNYPVERTGLRLIIQERFPNATVKELAAAGETSTNHIPDIIFVGLDKSDSSHKIQSVNIIRRRFPTAKIVVYDEYPVYETIKRYFESGISGYLLKQCALSELEACINKLMQGKKFIDSEAMNSFLQRASIKKKAESVVRRTLTSHEQHIATYLMQGMKVTAIAERLDRKVSTVSTIKANIFRKLGVDNIVSLGEKMRK